MYTIYKCYIIYLSSLNSNCIRLYNEKYMYIIGTYIIGQLNVYSKLLKLYISFNNG